MRLQKLQENEQVRDCEYYYDFINCGDCYLLTEWINDSEPTVTLNQGTNLEDLHEKHGGSIIYLKLCGKTFLEYKSMSGNWYEEDLDKVISWTEIDYAPDRYDYVQLLKALLTGEGLEEFNITSCIVRWANEGSSRGEDWYWVINDFDD